MAFKNAFSKKSFQKNHFKKIILLVFLFLGAPPKVKNTKTCKPAIKILSGAGAGFVAARLASRFR
jgi:hypothetical protein